MLPEAVAILANSYFVYLLNISTKNKVILRTRLNWSAVTLKYVRFNAHSKATSERKSENIMHKMLIHRNDN